MNRMNDFQLTETTQRIFFVIYALIRLSTDVFYSSQLIVENAERSNENGKSQQKKNRAV